MCTMNAKDRIQQYIDYKGISNSKFEIEQLLKLEP